MFYVAMLPEFAHRSIGGYWMNINGIQYGDETNKHINICECIIQIVGRLHVSATLVSIVRAMR